MIQLTAADRAELQRMQPTIEVLKAIVTSLGALNPQAMPTFSYALKAASTDARLCPIARLVVFHLAEGVDLLAGPSMPS